MVFFDALLLSPIFESIILIIIYYASRWGFFNLLCFIGISRAIIIDSLISILFIMLLFIFAFLSHSFIYEDFIYGINAGIAFIFFGGQFLFLKDKLNLNLVMLSLFCSHFSANLVALIW